MNCPPVQQLHRFLNDELPADEDQVVSLHIEACTVCQQSLERMTALDIDARAEIGSGEHQSVPTNGNLYSTVRLTSKHSTTLTDRHLAILRPLLARGPDENSDGAVAEVHGRWPTIAGYEILDELGHGGMSSVYRARDLRLGRIVAIKCLRNSELSVPAAQVRFRVESQMIARLQHPNIVRLLEFGSHEQQPYCVLEYVEGGSLADHLSGVPWAPHDAARLIETLAGAVEYSHQHGIVHRDLKPGNILLPSRTTRARSLEDAKIADFGLAKQLHTELSLTTTGMVAGTPSYMAPEQVRGESERIGPATDVYALGAILYELLTGRTPFSAVTPLEAMNEIIEREPLPPFRIVPQVPRDLASICLQCLAKDPARRYPSARALAEDLQRFRSGRAISARRSGVFERGLKWSKRKPALAALLALLLMLSVVGFPGAMLLWLDAARARDRALRSESAERWARYCANVAAAGSYLDQDNAEAARRALRAAPLEYRNWEWRHFWQRLQSRRMVLQGHPNFVLGVALSPDGRRVASISADSEVGEIRLWDASSGEIVNVLPSGRGGVSSGLTFDPHSRLLAAPGPDGALCLFTADNGEQLAVLTGHTGYPVAARFSPDGTKLLSGADGDTTLRLWDVPSRQAIGEWDLEAHITSMEFSPEGSYFAAGTDDGRVGVWDVEKNSLAARWPVHEAAISCLAFRPDGRNLVTSSVDYRDCRLRLWSVPGGKLLTTMEGHTNTVHAVRYSPDGSTVASASNDQTVRLWDARSGKARATLRGHLGAVLDVQFSSDGGRLASASHDSTVRIWDAVDGSLKGVLYGHTDQVHSLQFGQAGDELATASNDHTVILWDVRPSTRTNVIRGHTSYVYDVAYSPDGKRLASAAWDGTFRIWNVASGEELMRLSAGEPKIAMGVAFDPGGERLATIERGAMRLWDLETGECIHRSRMPDESPPAAKITFSPDGTLIAAGTNDGTIWWWDHSGRCVAVTPAHSGYCRDVAFSPDGLRLASVGYDEAAYVWDVRSRKRIAILKAHNRSLTAVEYSADGTLLATASEDGTVRLWDARDFTEQAALNYGRHIYDVAFHPEGTRLAIACVDNSVRIWDVATASQVADLRGHEAYVHALDFSPDGTGLVSGSGDFTLRIWDTVPANDPSEHTR